MKTEGTQQIDVAGNWTNLLFLEHLITSDCSGTAPVHSHGLTTGQTTTRCTQTNARRETEMSKRPVREITELL